jgi:hypothetical protein
MRWGSERASTATLRRIDRVHAPTEPSPAFNRPLYTARGLAGRCANRFNAAMNPLSFTRQLKPLGGPVLARWFLLLLIADSSAQVTNFCMRRMFNPITGGLHEDNSERHLL